MASIEIRDAGRDDLETILRLWWRLLREHHERDGFYYDLIAEKEFRIRYLEHVAEAMDHPESFVLIGELDGAAAGFILCSVLKRLPIYRIPMTGQVESIAVEPSARGRGLGRALLKEALARFETIGFDLVELRVDADNPGAIALYESLGFVKRLHQMVVDPSK